MTKKIAILSTDGFEESELQSPKEHLEEQGWTVHVVSPESGTIRAWAKTDWGKEYNVDRKITDIQADDYDALVLPGGLINPDSLRIDDDALQLVKDFHAKQKPIAAICHGPQILINAGLTNGRTMTSVKAIRQDLINAGVEWKNEEVVQDGHFITSRNPDDLPAFNTRIVEVVNNSR
jgi:protease I